MKIDQTKTLPEGLIFTAIGVVVLVFTDVVYPALFLTHLGALALGVAWGGWTQKKQMEAR